MEDSVKDIETRWQRVWAGMPDLYAARDDDTAPRRYVADMFPYPSGDLHMGHGEAFPIGDAIARYLILRGYDVLHPIAWDAFGLPAENAAIRRGADPAEWTRANIETQAASLRRYAISFDWSRRFNTCDVSYYRWNQWLFLRLYDRGLAYRATAPVNWCPSCATVLANEQVIGGECERCSTPVVERTLTQWFFRITAYADRLVDDLAKLSGGWPAHILTMQRNWIRHPDGGLRLHDWLISRQRYWGTPIPIVHCPTCGEVPAEIPVILPPRDEVESWAGVDCPRCGGPARRDTDTMDTFVDSSWYYLRYCSPSYEAGPFDPAAVRRWCPVDQYIGGAEHATGHLLYVRFITKFLYDEGLIGFDEPFRRLLTQGQVVMDGAAMSKSKGNMVALGEQVDRYGVDAVRLTMLFAGPPAEDIDWADVNPAGAVRFLARARRLATTIGPRPAPPTEGRSGPPAGPGDAAPPAGPGDAAPPAGPGDAAPPAGPGDAAPPAAPPTVPAAGDEEMRKAVHRCIAEVTRLVEGHRFNVAIARLMDLVGRAGRGDPADPAVRAAAEFAAVGLSLFVPYTAEEMWAALGYPPSVARAGWPSFDPALAAPDDVECVVQVAGRPRTTLRVAPDVDAATLERLALAHPDVRRAIDGRPVRRTVVKPPAVVSVVL